MWALNPDKCKKLEEECKRCRQRDPVNIRLSMSRPDDLTKIERGEQRLKKYAVSSQRKLVDTTNNSLVMKTANSIHLANSPMTTNMQITLPSIVSLSSNPQNDSYSLDWNNNKNSTVVLKEVSYEKNLFSILLLYFNYLKMQRA